MVGQEVNHIQRVADDPSRGSKGSVVSEDGVSPTLIATAWKDPQMVMTWLEE